MRESFSSDIEDIRSKQEVLLNEAGLIAGMPVILKKVVEENPNEPTKHSLSGTLDTRGQFGHSISVDNGRDKTPALEQIDIQHGRLYLRCGSAVYELLSTADATEPESQEKVPKPKSVTTARGSVYTYLEDGKTQRFKKAEESLKEPQDLLVFIPPWETIADKALELYPYIFEGVDNSVQFEQVILEYAQDQTGKKTIRPAINSEEVYSLVDRDPSEQVFLNFIDKENKRVDFILPTSREPKIGYSTFDARMFYDEETGNRMRERHIGNEVISIEY